jgi:RimJ/RimL family protein N-acetyltransferase
MPKKDIPPFEYGTVRLRLLREKDLPLTRSWRNQDHIRRWFFYSEIITDEQHQNWFNQYQERDDDFTFIIEEAQAGYRPVGQVALYHIDWPARRAEFGRLMIGELDAAGKGLALAATRAALLIGFGQLELREIYLNVLAKNQRAIQIYEKVGFTITEASSETIGMSIFSPAAG